MKEQKPLVIVLSRNYSTGLSIVRSIGNAGYPVDLIAITMKKGNSIIISKSKYVRKTTEIVIQNILEDKKDKILEILYEYTDNHKEKMILFPVDDFSASYLSENKDKIKDYFLVPGVSEDSAYTLVELMNKIMQGELARKAGLLTPKEWNISLKEEVAIPHDVVYPCFVKPLESISGDKTEMAKCESYEELESHLFKLKERYSERAVIVQEFLEIEEEYDLSGVCLDQKVIIPAIIKKVEIAKYEKGVTLSGKVEPTEKLGKVYDKIISMMKTYHYIGMFDMELNVVEDQIYFNEVNLRSGGPNFVYFKCGVNLPELVAKYLSGAEWEVPFMSEDNYGKTFVYEKVAWEEYIHGYMNKTKLKKYLNETDFKLLIDEDDPDPGKLFSKKIRLSALKNKVKAFIGVR